MQLDLSAARFFLFSLMLTLCSQVTFAQRDLDEALLLASPDMIAADSALKSHMEMLATEAVSNHCAACHGANLAGQSGVPNLVDYDWLWGVSGFEMTQSEAVFEIMQTILYGVRNSECADEIKRYGACPDTRFSQMPGYGELGFSEQQLNDLVDYVYGISGDEHESAAVERVAGLTVLCAECHGDDGAGYKAFGGPDLSDDVWLFGSAREAVYDVIANGRTESCPAWSQTLNAATIKALSVYIYNQFMGY